jgi:hypothetical protein
MGRIAPLPAQQSYGRRGPTAAAAEGAVAEVGEGDSDAQPSPTAASNRCFQPRRPIVKLRDLKRRGAVTAGGEVAAAQEAGPCAASPTTLMIGAALRDNDAMTESQDILETRSDLAHLDMLKHRIRAASYGMFGQDWDAIFGRFDKDGSGELDIDEFCAALRGHGEAAALSHDDLVDLFRRMDTDDSGTISAEEFRDFMAITPDERLRKKARDANGQGTQEYIVLASAFLRAGASLGSKRVGRLRKGEVVAALEVRGNRMQVTRLRFSPGDSAQVGWCSLTKTVAEGDTAAAPEPLLSLLERAEGALGNSGCPRWNSEHTQLRLQMMGQDITWASASRKRRGARRGSSGGGDGSSSSSSEGSAASVSSESSHSQLYQCDFQTGASGDSWIRMKMSPVRAAMVADESVPVDRTRRRTKHAGALGATLAPLPSDYHNRRTTSTISSSYSSSKPCDGSVSAYAPGSEGGEVDGGDGGSDTMRYTRIDAALRRWQRQRQSSTAPSAAHQRRARRKSAAAVSS